MRRDRRSCRAARPTTRSARTGRDPFVRRGSPTRADLPRTRRRPRSRGSAGTPSADRPARATAGAAPATPARASRADARRYGEPRLERSDQQQPTPPAIQAAQTSAGSTPRTPYALGALARTLRRGHVSIQAGARVLTTAADQSRRGRGSPSQDAHDRHPDASPSPLSCVHACTQLKRGEKWAVAEPGRTSGRRSPTPRWGTQPGLRPARAAPRSRRGRTRRSSPATPAERRTPAASPRWTAASPACPTSATSQVAPCCVLPSAVEQQRIGVVHQVRLQPVGRLDGHPRGHHRNGSVRRSHPAAGLPQPRQEELVQREVGDQADAVATATNRHPPANLVPYGILAQQGK